MFHGKELEKVNHTEFRIEKVIQKSQAERLY